MLFIAFLYKLLSAVAPNYNELYIGWKLKNLIYKNVKLKMIKLWDDSPIFCPYSIKNLIPIFYSQQISCNIEIGIDIQMVLFITV